VSAAGTRKRGRLELKSTFDGRVTLVTRYHGATDSHGRMIRQSPFTASNARAGRTASPGRRAALTPMTPILHLFAVHDWKTSRKRDDARKIGYDGHACGCRPAKAHSM